MATPATIVGDVRDASHLAASVHKLQGTHEHALWASVYHVTWAVVSGLEAYWVIAKVEFVPRSFSFRKREREKKKKRRVMWDF